MRFQPTSRPHHARESGGAPGIASGASAAACSAKVHGKTRRPPAKPAGCDPRTSHPGSALRLSGGDSQGHRHQIAFGTTGGQQEDFTSSRRSPIPHGKRFCTQLLIACSNSRKRQLNASLCQGRSGPRLRESRENETFGRPQIIIVRVSPGPLKMNPDLDSKSRHLNRYSSKSESSEDRRR